jgi:antitoxin HicB
MFKFPARFESAPEGGYVVTFRDIPEAITQGDTLEEAQSMAVDALVTAMDFYFEDGRAVPTPSKARRLEKLIALPPSVACKVELLNRVVESKTRPVDLARRMGIKSQEVTRILDLHHSTKVDTLAQAFEALGFELEVSVRQKEAAHA